MNKFLDDENELQCISLASINASFIFLCQLTMQY